MTAAAIWLLCWTVASMAFGVLIGQVINHADAAETEQPTDDTEDELYIPRTWTA